MALDSDFAPQTPLVRPKFEIYTPKRDDEYPRHFYRGVPPPGAQFTELF